MSTLRRYTYDELLDAFPDQEEPLVEGLLYRGDVVNIVSPPKSAKSMLMLSLASALNTGARWLGLFDTKPCRVLIADAELRPIQLKLRSRAVGGGGDELRGVEFLPFRVKGGGGANLPTVRQHAEECQADVIIIDPLYKFEWDFDFNENDNAAMTKVYARLDAVAQDLECAIVVVHHPSKGIQAGRPLSDIGAGGGAQSRAADAHMVLRPHRVSGCHVLDGLVRNWSPIKPPVLEFSFPHWRHRPDLSAADLDDGPVKERKGKGGAAKWTAEGFVARFVTESPESRISLIAKAKAAGVPASVAADLIRLAAERGLMHAWPKGGAATPQLYASVPGPVQSDGEPKPKRKRAAKAA